MISFELSEEEKIIKKTAEDFGKILREQSRKAEKEGVSDQIKRKYSELGFGLMDISEELGGFGYGLFRKVLALQCMSWGCAATTLSLELSPVNLHLIQSIDADKDTKTKFKEEVMHNPWGIYIDFDGNFSVRNQKFSGKAWAVLGKNISKFALIKGDEFFIFDEFDIVSKKPLALDAVGLNEVNLENSSPLYSSRINYKRFISVIRVYLTAILSGILRASFEYASQYAVEREAFGKKIAHHQGLAFALSDFSISVSIADLCAWRSAWSLDSGQENFEQICADSFSYTAELAEKFTVWGVQILGGHGFVKDHMVEKWMREAKAISLLFGGKYYADLDSFGLNQGNLLDQQQKV